MGMLYVHVCVDTCISKTGLLICASMAAINGHGPSSQGDLMAIRTNRDYLSFT